MSNPMQDNKPLHIVGIGASAGGLNALEQFFDSMPADSGMAFVVIQHLSPNFKSKMDDLLRQHSDMPVQVVADNAIMKPNNIYLNPAMAQLTISGGVFHLTEIAGGRRVDYPIDIFFTSLAENMGPQAIAVVLSGTGKDGSQGVQAIHGKGGLVIVQSPESAQYDAMPQNAIATGAADFILPPDEIPGVLMEHMIAPVGGRGEKPETSAFRDEDSEFAEICRLLQKSFNLDFARYKLGTVGRRIRRRMGFRQVAAVSDYAAILTADPDELDNLYHDLLIGVTEFFHDEQTFRCLETTIIPELFSLLAPDQELRVWSAGCASGEEAYSLAILLAEKAAELNFSGKISVFATDVHKRSLEIAARGVYPRERLTRISPERLKRHFTEVEKDLFKVNADLRKLMVFARHDLTNDVPFTRIDLVSCRNLLIYLRPEAQKKVLAQLQFALNRDGILFLGMSEGVGPFAGEFQTLSDKDHLFRKIGEQRLMVERDHDLIGTATVVPPASIYPLAQKRLASLDRQVLHDYDTILDKHVPPGVLIDGKSRIIHYFGNVAEFLKAPRGRAENDILRLADDNLQVALSNSLHKVKKSGQSIMVKNIRVNHAAGEFRVDMTMEPIPYEKSEFPHYHVYFERIRPLEQAPLPELHETLDANQFEFNAHYRQHVADLETELEAAKEDFLVTQENLQATIEELNATNEELQATNEEFQSTNEELNSGNEELQATNEELLSVSTELERSNSELKLLNVEHTNLLDSLESGIVFLDRQMCIRKFNPAISNMFKLMPQDIGRPIDHIAYHLDNQERMMKDIRSVLATGVPLELEVASKDGKCLLRRIVPFRSETGQMEGATLMFTDISKVKEAEKAFKTNEKLQNAYENLEKESAERVRILEKLRKQEQMLIQQNRMAAMGEMLNNIAHQWRQPLNMVGLLVQEIGLFYADDELNQEILDANINKAMGIVAHMSQTIEDFRSFFTPDKSKSTFRVDQVVNKSISLMADALKSQEITIDVSVIGEPEIFGYSNEYAQVLINLMMNAKDAFQERKVREPRVTVRIWKEDGKSVVTITDNAGGIPVEIMDKIFDAYFTTKELGKGTGIGLFMSNAIIEQNMGGRLTVRNVEDGAEFRIEV